MCKNKYCDPSADISKKHTFIFETLIHQHLLHHCKTKVEKPESADVFFVPVYFGIYNLHAKRASLKNVVLPLLDNEGMWYSRYGGIDHIFTQLLFSHRKIPITLNIQKNFPAMITIGDIDHDYSIHSPREAWRLTNMPYISNYEEFIEDDYNNFDHVRNIPMFFIGQTSISHFDPRAKLVRTSLFEEMQKMRYAVSIDTERKSKNKSAEMFDIFSFMKESDFCPVPHGDGPSSKRLYDALKARCIPILLSDEIRFPFENLFADYSGAVLQIPMYESESISSILGMITEEDKKEMRSRIADLTPLLNVSWNGESVNGDLIWAWKWAQYFKTAAVSASKRRNQVKNRYYSPHYERSQ